MFPFICSIIEFGSPEFDAAVQLRYEILRAPLGLDYAAEQLAQEWSDYHIAAFSLHLDLIGYLCLSLQDEKTVKMRQVAVARDVQGKGVGTAMVLFSEEKAKDWGFNKIEMNARTSAVHFYQKLNYRVVSPEFIEVGIPHVKMEKYLQS